RLRQAYPQATLVGLDKGYFAHCLTNAEILPECRADIQYFAYVRRLRPEVLQGVDAVVHLAAISNDPMGNTFEEVTFDINFVACPLSSQKLSILTDSSSCSPLTLVKGIARSFDCVIVKAKGNADFLAVNVGTNTWNYHVTELVEAVAKFVPRVGISINQNAP